MSRIGVGMSCLMAAGGALAEIVEFDGSPDPLPHDGYVNVVSEARSPIQRAYIEADDGVYIAAAIRKPEGAGPFPALVMFHGAPGGRGMEQLVGWSRGDHGGPAWERFLEEGFVVAVADYRGGPFAAVNAPAADGRVTAIDDGIAVVDYVRQLPYVDGARVSVYGVSLGGNLVLFLASKIPDLHAVVAGAPAPIWFLGADFGGFGRDDASAFAPDLAVAEANIAPIKTPILIQVGTEDPLLGMNRVLHEQLVANGKDVRMEIYAHGYHDFVLGPQGHDRPDLPRGEVLLQATLDALDRSVRFVETLR